MKISTALLTIMTAQVASGAAAQEPQPRVATKAQYASCLDTKDSVDQKTAILLKRQEDQKALALKFQAADDNLNAQIKRHTPKTKDEIGSYNRAVESRNLVAKDFNDRDKGLERDQEALNNSIYRLNELCGSLLIPSEVKEEVEQERKARSAKQ